MLRGVFQVGIEVSEPTVLKAHYYKIRGFIRWQTQMASLPKRCLSRRKYLS